MARRPSSPWPTTPGSVFFAGDAAPATLSRAVNDGRIRRLAQRLYSADLTASPDALVERNRWRIVSRFVPDALIADRSAANNGLPERSVLYVVSNERVNDLELPGLIVSPRKGPGPLDDDSSWADGLRVTSDARTLVDNLAISRGRGGRLARTLSRAELEDWVVRKARLRPDGWLQQLRYRAIEIAEELGVPDRQSQVEELVGAVAGTRPVRAGAGRLLTARAAGGEWDPARVERFDELASYLNAIPEGADVPAFLESPPGDLDGTLPFFEAYFSNFIEGTEFTVEEAEEIVASGEAPADRPEDAHDVLGTFRVVSDPVGRATVPNDADELLQLLRLRHVAIMSGRPEKRPGEFKEKRNQAGSYVFVDADLVVGTLAEGFRRLDDLPPGFPRAAYQLFLISEVHPFDDGNGRVARAAMCAELTAVDQCRILVPIVFRNEYLTALRALSRDGHAELYARMLACAWRWTAGMPWHDRTAIDGRLQATNALMDSTDAERSSVRLELP
jgi:hypothetical protein